MIVSCFAIAQPRPPLRGERQDREKGTSLAVHGGVELQVAASIV
jgi:hypothetical protein